jgi:hypothetical protein
MARAFGDVESRMDYVASPDVFSRSFAFRVCNIVFVSFLLPSSTATRIQQAAPPTPSRLKKPARVLNAQGTPLPSAITTCLQYSLEFICLA